MTGLLLPDYRVNAAGGGAFDVETDISWHSLWYAEGTDFVAESYSDGADVSPWPNETGEADLTQATASNRPHYRATPGAGVLNNQPCVELDDADSQYVQTAAFSSNPDYTNGISVVVIADTSTISNSGYLLDGISSGNRNAVFRNASTTEWAYFAGTVQIGSITARDNQLHVVRFPGSTSTHAYDINGSSNSTADPGAVTLTGLTLAGRFNGANYGHCHVALVGIYQGDIESDGAWSDFTDWVDSKYGITIP